MKKRITQVLLLGAILFSVAQAETPATKTFYFGRESAPSGAAHVEPQAVYSADAGYGWLKGQPNLFTVQVPEGNYDVSVAYATPEAAATSTVKAESRRLMLLKQNHAEGQVCHFTVSVRQPEIDGGAKVRLNDREKPPTSFQWDDLLTLEFLPGIGGVETVSIGPAPQAVTVYIAGDSTVADQRREPWGGWGQALPRFFEPGVAVANHSESGRALFSFRYEKRLDKILSTIRPGDYLFVQFGHNDQKNKREGAGPFTTYKKDLEDFVDKVRAKGADPVLVTPMERRRWSGGKPDETLTEFAAAVRQVGQEQKVPVIDLHAMSLQLYAALGESGSKRAFVFYPANTFPGQDKELKDNTHHNTYGGYELARCIVEGIKEQLPDLAKHLRDDVGSFDPSHPDDPDSLGIPPSVAAEIEKHEGS